MISALGSGRRRLFVGAGAVALLAFVFGSLFVLDSEHAADLLGAILFVPLVMTSVATGVAVWIFAAMFKPTPALATNVGLIVIATAWLGSFIRHRGAIRPVLPGQRHLVGVLGLLIAWLTLSLFWAHDKEAAWQQLRVWLIAVGVLFMVATAVNTPGQVRVVMLAFVAGAIAEVILGLSLDVGGRFAGTGGNPDDLANELLPAIVFGVALIVDRKSLRERVVLIAAVIFILRYFVATESRGAFLALVCVVPASLVVFRRQQRYVMPAVGIAILVLAFALVVSAPARDRLLDFGGGGSGRTTLWLVAWRMARTHQPEGIGLNNFTSAAEAYVQQPGALTDVEQIIDQPHVVHNAYLGLLAETGVVGLVLYLSVVYAALAAALAASRNFERRGRNDLAWLARAVLLAAFSFLFSQFFASDATDFRLWAILALGPALFAMSVRAVPSRQPAVPSS